MYSYKTINFVSILVTLNLTDLFLKRFCRIHPKNYNWILFIIKPFSCFDSLIVFSAKNTLNTFAWL